MRIVEALRDLGQTVSGLAISEEQAKRDEEELDRLLEPLRDGDVPPFPQREGKNLLGEQ